MPLIWTAFLLVGSPADAGKSAPEAVEERLAVALFPLVVRADDTSPVVAAAKELLDGIGEHVPDVRVVEGDALTAALGNPSRALGRCGSNMKCLAGLGKKAKVREVLIGRAVAGEGTIEIRFLVIGTKSAAIERKLAINASTADELRETLLRQLYPLMGLTDPGFVAIRGQVGQLEVDGRVIDRGDEPLLTLEPGPHRIVVDGEFHGVLVRPGKTAVIEVAAPLALVPVPVEVEVIEEDTPYLIYGGIGSGVLAVGLAIGGAAFAAERSSLADPEPGETQLARIERIDSANVAGDRATALFATAGVAAVAGAALVLIDWYVLEDTAVSAHVGGSGAGVNVRIPW